MLLFVERLLGLFDCEYQISNCLGRGCYAGWMEVVLIVVDWNTWLCVYSENEIILMTLIGSFNEKRPRGIGFAEELKLASF